MLKKVSKELTSQANRFLEKIIMIQLLQSLTNFIILLCKNH